MIKIIKKVVIKTLLKSVSLNFLFFFHLSDEYTNISSHILVHRWNVWNILVISCVCAMSCDGKTELQNGWSPASEDTCCSFSVWVYVSAWAWCFCVLFSLRVYRNLEIMHTCIQIPSSQLSNSLSGWNSGAHVESAHRLASHQTLRSRLY